MASTEFSNSGGTDPGDRDIPTPSSTSEEWTKIVTRGSAARAKHTGATSAANDNNDFETVTWAKFNLFQPRIFPILTKLSKDPLITENAFT